MKTISFLAVPASQQSVFIRLLQNLMLLKRQLKYAYILCGLLLSFNFLLAQKKDKSKEEFKTVDVKPQCADLPREKRARVRVSSFRVTTSTSSRDDSKRDQQSSVDAFRSIFGKGNKDDSKSERSQPTLGENMAIELTMSLQNVNCFRVLDYTNEDNKKEINDDFNSKNSSAKSGHGLGAQILVVGDVTEYSVSSKNQHIMGFSSGHKMVKLGFVLYMKNPETNELIVQHQFRIQSQTGKSFSVPGYSTSDQDPDVAAVMADGIIQATQWMSHVRDSLNITADGNFAGNAGTNGEKTTEITLNNANFTSFNAFGNILSGISAYKSMDKSLSGGVGNYTVIHTGSTDAFVTLLNKKMGSAYEITGAESGKIELKAK